MPVTFAEKLRELRAAANLTQGGLAEACGMPMGTVRNYEQGIREPSWQTLFKLAKSLGVSVEVFAECVEDGADVLTARPGRPPKEKPETPPAKPVVQPGRSVQEAAEAAAKADEALAKRNRLKRRK